MLWDEFAPERCYYWQRVSGLTGLPPSTLLCFIWAPSGVLFLSNHAWVELGKRRKKNRGGEKSLLGTQEKLHKPWSGVGWAINNQANMKKSKDSWGRLLGVGGWEGWSSAVLCLRLLIQTHWIAFSRCAWHSGSSVGVLDSHLYGWDVRLSGRLNLQKSGSSPSRPRVPNHLLY